MTLNIRRALHTLLLLVKYKLNSIPEKYIRKLLQVLLHYPEIGSRSLPDKCLNLYTHIVLMYFYATVDEKLCFSRLVNCCNFELCVECNPIEVNTSFIYTLESTNNYNSYWQQ